METKYEFYSFGGEVIPELSAENFQKSKNWDLQLIQSRNAVRPLRKYQGLTAFKDNFSEAHIEKLNIPSQDPRVILVIDYHAFAGSYNKIKPLQVIEACSRWNEEFDAQIYICGYVNPGHDDHSKLLARFDDPAFQRVFEGLFVVYMSLTRHFGKDGTKLPECIKEEFSNEELPLLYVDSSLGGGDMIKLLESSTNSIEKIEKYIRYMLESMSNKTQENEKINSLEGIITI